MASQSISGPDAIFLAYAENCVPDILSDPSGVGAAYAACSMVAPQNSQNRLLSGIVDLQFGHII